MFIARIARVARNGLKTALRPAVRALTTEAPKVTEAAAEAAAAAATEAAAAAAPKVVAPAPGAFKKVLLAYDSALMSSPVKTKALTSLVLYGLGDVFAQTLGKFQGCTDPWDLKRITRACTFGLLIGPVFHYHYNFLDFLAKNVAKVSTTIEPFFKLGIEQFVYFAPFFIASYHFTLSMLSGDGVDASVKRTKKLWWPALKCNWLFWPIVGYFNFRFVPLPYQLNFVLANSFLWAAFLSFKFPPDVKEPAPVVEEEEDEITKAAE